jgi:small redox-active disulfide protein 2
MKKMQILGTGCAKCQRMTENAEEAMKGLEGECTIEKVTAIEDIMMFGVMMTPALLVNDEIKVMGRVPSVQEIRDMLVQKPVAERRKREPEDVIRGDGESGNRRNRERPRRRGGEQTNEKAGEVESGGNGETESGGNGETESRRDGELMDEIIEAENPGDGEVTGDATS